MPDGNRQIEKCHKALERSRGRRGMTMARTGPQPAHQPLQAHETEKRSCAMSTHPCAGQTRGK